MRISKLLPVDRILRDAIAKHTDGQVSIYPANAAWSRIASNAYEGAICGLRTVLGSSDSPTIELWRMEALWRPAAAD